MDLELKKGKSWSVGSNEMCIRDRCNAVYVADIYIQNTPQITTANAILRLQNQKGKTAKQDLRITVYEWQNKEKIVY